MNGIRAVWNCQFLAYDVAQSALDPAGTQASSIAHLWWNFFGVLLVVFLVVAIFLLIAIFRRRNENGSPGSGSAAGEQRLTGVVTGAVIITIITLFVLLIRDFLVGNKIYALSDSDALAIKLVGHQWWWEAQYSDPEPSRIVTTANELHIPVGKVVKFELQSTDVIHSLWVPNLHGKRDLVPGHPTTVLLRADREGEYHGQCAEFCGYQHAHMRILIVADKPPKFEKWLDTQRQDARPPATPIAKSGRDVFLTSQCVMCHNIAGTDARATLGPDLSHIGSHKTLAAGSFTNTPEVLAKWISDPQKMKPGVLMPPNELSADALNALVAYLENLK